MKKHKKPQTARGKKTHQTKSNNKKRWINGDADGFVLNGKTVSRSAYQRKANIPQSWKTARKRGS